MNTSNAVLIFSALFISLFIFSTPNSHSTEDAFYEYWMGIYSGEDRIGYSYNSIKTTDGVTDIVELMKLRLILLGKEDKAHTRASYKLVDDKIVSFTFFIDSDTMDLKARGERHGDTLRITMDTVSGTTQCSMALEKEPTVASLIPKLLINNNLSVGQSYEIPLFEPLAFLMGKAPPVSTHSIEAKEILEIPSGKFDTYKVSSSFMGAHSTSWITQEGEVLKQTFPPGLVAVKESEEDIVNKKSSSFDIAEKTSIASNKKLENAAELKYMRIKIGGIDALDELDIHDGYRQQLNGNTVEIKTDHYSTENPYTLPYSGDQYSGLTQAELLIQSDDKEIIAITDKILDGERDPLKAAQKINKWIYKNLKKSATVSIPNAKDVLKTKTGDCNEHAALFSAMSRAAGIPTKTVLGAMYYNGRFYYHAWNEVYIGDWVAVDSTYGQLPADATHIKLIEGDLAKSAEIIKVVGKIKIEIIDAS